MASVLRASDEAAKEAGADKSRLCLTDNEIFGNIYIYNVAGHETSAVTLAYTIALLACFPEWQDWASLELDVVFGEREVCETDYEQAYPKLNRCLALMVSSLRSHREHWQKLTTRYSTIPSAYTRPSTGSPASPAPLPNASTSALKPTPSRPRPPSTSTTPASNVTALTGAPTPFSGGLAAGSATTAPRKTSTRAWKSRIWPGRAGRARVRAGNSARSRSWRRWRAC